MVRHGARVKITEERLEQVEAFFERRGGMTILIGRFIGLVRAIAPFVAGASRMPLRKFLPYDVLGAGLWATTFCVLGFVFWRSFDQLTTWVSRGLFAFGLVVALIVGIVFLVRLQRNPELRGAAGAWIAAQLEKPLLRPVAPYLRAGWQRVGRPARARRRRRRRGSSGTASRRASSGSRSRRCSRSPRSASFTFALLGSELQRARPAGARPRGVRRRRPAVLRAASRTWSCGSRRSARSPSAPPLVLATATWAALRRRYLDAAVLVGRVR